MSAGVTLVVVYFLVTYAAPLAGNIAYGNSIVPSTRTVAFTRRDALFILATFALFILLGSDKAPRLPAWRPARLVRLAAQAGDAYRRRWRLFFAVGALALAIAFTWKGLNGYRYGDASVLDSGSKLLVVSIFVHVLVLADLVTVMFFMGAVQPRRGSRAYWETTILAVSLVISADGVGTIFLGLAALAYALAPATFRRVAFIRQEGPRGQRVLWGALIVLALLVFVVVARFIGETIKLMPGGEVSFSLPAFIAAARRVAASSMLAPSAAFGFDAALVERLSTYYYSFLYTLDSGWRSLNAPYGWTLFAPLNTALFRANYLLGGVMHVGRPAVGSISRVNLLALYVTDVGPRNGASPGLLASFLYVFPWPLALISCALFLRWIGHVTDHLVLREPGERLSLGGAVVLLMFTLTIFQSPFDLLRIFDESVVFFAVLFVLYKVRQMQVLGPHADAMPGGVARTDEVLVGGSGDP